MATFQLSSTTQSGTASKTLTYSGPDAQRIFNAWAKLYWDVKFPKPPPATHQDFIDFMANECSRQFTAWTQRAETTPPAPPDITTG